MGGETGLNDVSTVLTTSCKAFQPEALQLSRIEIVVSTLSVVPLLYVVRTGRGRFSLLVYHRKWKHCCALLTRKEAFKVQVRSSVTCSPKNYVPFTNFTTILLMEKGM